jgi:hypothetical protein
VVPSLLPRGPAVSREPLRCPLPMAVSYHFWPLCSSEVPFGCAGSLGPRLFASLSPISRDLLPRRALVACLHALRCSVRGWLDLAPGACRSPWPEAAMIPGDRIDACPPTDGSERWGLSGIDSLRSASRQVWACPCAFTRLRPSLSPPTDIHAVRPSLRIRHARSCVSASCFVAAHHARLPCPCCPCRRISLGDVRSEALPW